MALQLLLGVATTQDWLGHSLFEIASKPLCPFYYDIDGWAANPWVGNALYACWQRFICFQWRSSLAATADLGSLGQ